MKRRFLAILMAASMVFSLAACGDSSGGEADAGGAEESAEAEAEDTSGDIEELTITFNSTYSENETNGQLVTKFQEYLDETSGGKITLDILWGGTVYDDTTQFQALRDGAVDMISFNNMQDADYVPYLNFGSYGTGSAENVYECWNQLLFEDEECSALIEEEAAQYNMKYLNNIGNGIDALVSTFEWDTLDEFIAGCQTVGVGDTAKFEAMGLNVSFVVPPEAYDALQRGICDSSNCSLAAIYSMSWDEVAPNVVTDGLWACGGSYTVNLDFWNGLSEAQQNAIQEAADMLGEYSLEMNAELEESMIAEIEERSGITVKALSDEDAATFFKYVFDTNADNALNRVAGDEEKTANMIKILEKAASFYDYEWEH
ncbi:MAG: TRAP transporter substrate-binding protein DctP [Eubacterium sp.]|nr:TRAP transporter substrate-binding protein DctP [Eubacterium sp.]